MGRDFFFIVVLLVPWRILVRVRVLLGQIYISWRQRLTLSSSPITLQWKVEAIIR